MNVISGQTGTMTAPDAGNPPKGHKPSLKSRALSTGKKMLSMTLYLWALLALLNLHKMVVLQQQHIDYEAQSLAIVNALILMKVMLIADDLGMGSRFGNKRLIYRVLYSSFVFAVLLVSFHILEEGLIALLHGKPFSNSLAGFGAGNLAGVLEVGVIVFAALIPFFLGREIARVVGGAALWDLIMSRRTPKFALVVQE